MHKTYRQLIFGFISLILFITTCNRCRQRQIARQTWTPELEQQMRDIFYTQTQRITTNEQEKNDYADCCMSKIKEIFPNGISGMGADMSDSVKIAILKMGTDCAKSFQSFTNAWEPVVVEQLKLTIYSYAETKLLPQKMKQEYVDCLAYKIIAKFPKGLQGAGKDSIKNFLNTERTKCLKLLTNKYGKLKAHNRKADTATTR